MSIGKSLFLLDCKEFMAPLNLRRMICFILDNLSTSPSHQEAHCSLFASYIRGQTEEARRTTAPQRLKQKPHYRKLISMQKQEVTSQMDRWGLPGGISRKEHTCQCCGHKEWGFDPLVGKMS